MPKGVNEIYVSGCGGGGGMAYSNTFKRFVSGGNAAYVIDQKVDVSQGDVFSITVGDGGLGTADTNKGTVLGERGGDTVIKKNGTEIIKLAGGNGGSEYANAGNQTGESFFDDTNAWGFDAGHLNGFPSSEDIFSQIRYALNVWPTPLFPFGIGAALIRNSAQSSCMSGYGSSGILFFKYIQCE